MVIKIEKIFLPSNPMNKSREPDLGIVAPEVERPSNTTKGEVVSLPLKSGFRTRYHWSQSGYFVSKYEDFI